MPRIPFLPRWVLPATLPSVYDSESATSLEMVAKCYGAMKKMVEDYNAFADEINAEIQQFTSSSSAEIENFKKYVEERLICKFNDLDARYAEIKAEMLQYTETAVAAVYKKYLDGEMNQLINEKIANGDIEITLVYDPDTESLNMTTGGE